MRHVCLIDTSTLRKNNRFYPLFSKKHFKNFSGRNNRGRITSLRKMSKHKKSYRLVDTKRSLYNIKGFIYSYEYDPNRSSFISLIVYNNFICCYILSIQNTFTGDIVCSYSYENEDIPFFNKGDNHFLLFIPSGSLIHNLESLPGHGGIYIRSAGTYGKIIKKYMNYKRVLICLPSNQYIYASIYSRCTIGIVSNVYHNKISLGKAGRNRWLGNKSKVRGVAMNPVDHPHGGGEGKKSNPSFKRSPWGKISKWRNKKKKVSFFHYLN